MGGNATTLDLTRKENGAKTNAYHWELSADGRVLTATATAFRPSGPVTTTRSSHRESQILMALLASGGTRATFSDMPI